MCSLSPDQRYRKAYDTFVSLYPVDSASYLNELNKLYRALKCLYRGRTKIVPGSQALYEYLSSRNLRWLNVRLKL
jgi:hypothetical protein